MIEELQQIWDIIVENGGEFPRAEMDKIPYRKTVKYNGRSYFMKRFPPEVSTRIEGQYVDNISLHLFNAYLRVKIAGENKQFAYRDVPLDEAFEMLLADDSGAYYKEHIEGVYSGQEMKFAVRADEI